MYTMDCYNKVWDMTESGFLFRDGEIFAKKEEDN